MSNVFEKIRNRHERRGQEIGHAVLNLDVGQIRVPSPNCRQIGKPVHGSVSRFGEDGGKQLVVRNDSKDGTYRHTDTTIQVVSGEFDYSPVDLKAWRSECHDGVDPCISVYPPEEGVPELSLRAIAAVVHNAERVQHQPYLLTL